MSEIAPSDMQAAGGAGAPRTRRERAAAEADFGDLFARFAQSTALGAARNGSMSLQIAGAAAPVGAGAGAQRLPGGSASGAPEARGLRDRTTGPGAESREAGRDRPDASQSERAARRESQTGSETRQPGAATESAGHGEKPSDAGRSKDDTGERESRGGEAGDARNAGAQGAAAAQGAGAAASAGARAGRPESAQVSGVSAVGKAGAVTPGNSAGAGLFAELQSQGRRAGQAVAAGRAAREPGPQQSASFRAQLTQGLSAALRQGRGLVTLRLRPDSLGELEVKLQVKGSVVHARITPSTIEAQRLLEQNIDSLRRSFEARGLQPGRIEIQAPDAGREAHAGSQQPTGQEGRAAGGGEERRSSEESAGGGGAFAGGDPAARGSEVESSSASQGYGSPGVVYGVADGAARIVMVDALA